VRDALSALGAEEDFRVRALTDAEPPARPLGPYAVVDVVAGAAPALAAQREACGYYLLAKGLLAADDRRPPTTPPTHPPSRSPDDDRSPGGGASASAGDPSTGEAAAPEPPRNPFPPTVAERIAPRRRVVGARGTEPLPPPPRGRFAQLPAEQPTLEVLDAERLADLLAQHGHRPALLRALGAGRGSTLTAHSLDRALERAGLLEGAAEREHELVLATLEEQRGALGRAAWSLGVRASELLAWAERLGATAAVDRIRDRFRREALQPAHWTARLDLLGKRKYLEDLGVTADFERKLLEDLGRALDATPGLPEARIGSLANHLGVAPEILRRSLLRLGLLPATTPAGSPPPA
jgi:hypothetical protein